jgi:hypothetical protein
VLRRLSQLLLLSVATLAGCNFDAVPIGPPGDAGDRQRTEDEKLAMFGLRLAGTWRGRATITTFISEEPDVYFVLEWTPDSDPARSGQLSIHCVPGAADCMRVAGAGALFRYSLYESSDQGNARGAIELLDEGEFSALGTLDLKLSGSELSFIARGPPTFLFAGLSGKFTQDPLPAPSAPDAGPSFPGPNP